MFKDYFYCVLSERLLLFSVSAFAYDISLVCIDFLYEWGLLKNGKISGNVRCLNDFLIETISDVRRGVEEFAQKENMKLYFFNFDVEFGNLERFIEDTDAFNKKIQRYCKKYLCNGKIIPVLKEKHTFKSIEYDDMKCLNLIGEDLEEVLKKLYKKTK